MKKLDIAYLAISTAVALVCVWGTLQCLAPMINEAAATLAQIPNLFSILFVGRAVTYIFKGLVD